MSLFGTLANNAGKNIGGVILTETKKLESPVEGKWVKNDTGKGVEIYTTPKKQTLA